MKAILLSIKPEYVKQILNGTKKFEYRKRLSKRDVDIIYIYSTAPKMKVVASVEVVDRISAAPSTLWEDTKNFAGISHARYREYFYGCTTAYAYKLGTVQIFDTEKELSDFGVNAAPQSFIYIDVNDDN